jgi:hypothetical protein
MVDGLEIALEDFGGEMAGNFGAQLKLMTDCRRRDKSPNCMEADLVVNSEA